MKGTAIFKNEEIFNKYIFFYMNSKLKELDKIMVEKEELINPQNKESFEKAYSDYSEHETFFRDREYYDEKTKQKFKNDISFINNYITSINSKYNLIDTADNIAIIQYGEKIFPIFNYQEYLDIVEIEEMSDKTIFELKNKMLQTNGSSPLTVMLKDDVSADEIKKETSSLNEELSKTKKEISDIYRGENKELKSLQEEIDRLKQSLEQKKENMLKEINKKKEEMELKIKALNKKLTILKDTIYTIQCYLGETIEFFQIRSGINADDNKPIIINQKMKFLDEDLGQLASLYFNGDNLNDYSMFEELLRYNNTALEYFCPFDKCISFFRCSKDNRQYFVNGKNMLENYILLHGTKIGFILRNGENVYLGYTDDEKVFLNDDVFLKSKIEIVPDDDKKVRQSSYKELASRMFIFSILQGLLEKEEIIKFPEKVDIFNTSDSNKYIKWNYAEGWIEDNRFGTFSNLVTKLNQIKTVGDKILVIADLQETNEKRGESDRGNAEYVNRTYDCVVDNGLNTINFINKENTVFVAAVKQNSEYGSTSNFLLDSNEYINLTYMNSEWLKYFISTKSIGDFKGNYAYIVRYLKMALDYLVKREQSEENLIKQHYPNINKVEQWVVILSHWKLLNHVRAITPYQAKRFAKYLNSGNVTLLTNLYSEPFIMERHFEFRDKDIKETDVEGISVSRWRSEKCYTLNVHSSSLNKIQQQEDINTKHINDAYEIVSSLMQKNNVSAAEIFKYVSKDKSEEYLYDYFFNEDFTPKEYSNEFVYKVKFNYHKNMLIEHTEYHKVIWQSEIIKHYKQIPNIIEIIKKDRYDFETYKYELQFI